MKKLLYGSVVALTATAAAVLGAGPGVATGSDGDSGGRGSAGSSAAAGDHAAYVYRIADGAKLPPAQLATFDLLEDRDGNDLFVLGDARTAATLKDAGLKATLEQRMAAAPKESPKRSGQAPHLTRKVAEETYYGGYRTVNAQYAHLDKVAQDHADLATVVDFGDSWRKSSGAQNGYDLKAICLTKKGDGDCELKPGSTKPRFLVQAQVHARELTTGEMAYRWIDHLVNGYGKDETVTKLLDSREIWVVPIGNPDGVDMVQQGFMGGSSGLQWHRKSANDTGSPSGGCAENSFSGDGIDLNRNNFSHWGGPGTSSDPCNQTFKGLSSESEVENKALHGLYRNLFPDTRAEGDGTAADAGTKGMFVTMHSYSNMVLFPWGAGQSTGNDAALRAMGKEMATLAGGWEYGQPGEILYEVSGSHDDSLYDDLGVPSFTWEVGPSGGTCGGFHPKYTCQDGFWDQVKPMLTYAAEKAEAPYGS
ncbi:carboxypeptidase [Streptomyces sp. NA04227]|uniref:M14 family zinc carboxypeptidase n=1 Tax=Streptomyces sp. NA04227 TaxID=2742136 RepID=UPI0015926D44|nr:M14 family zinc carboxypeptidase [Streptomyces sp. NA04227]QKW08269.1 carboxypeptidase [Streptomyces sp. NA04227]